MTAGVKLEDLVPGDQILDLLISGTVVDVQVMTGRAAGNVHISFVDGTFLIASRARRVITTQETR